MKKWFGILLFSFVLILFGGCVEAASFKVSASTSQVNPNGTFRVSVGGDCIGRVNLSVSNGTLSQSSVWVEQNNQTVTVTAGSSGSVTVTATPATGFSDADANEYKPGARSVKVTISNPSNNSNPSVVNPSNQKPTNSSNNSVKKPQTIEPVEEKSSNNLLSSLSTDIGTLVPDFNAEVSEYSIQLPKEATSISINAVSSDSKARIERAGKTAVGPGENIIMVVVIAENGAQRIYTIKVYVDETPQVYLKYKDQEIGVVRNLRDVTIPEGFQKKEHTVNEQVINIFDNGHFSIIYGIDSENKKNFYIMDLQNNQCINKIIPTTIANHFFYLVDLQKPKEGFELSTITIEEKEIMGYRFKNGFVDYFLLSVMNNEGEMIDYLYETKEGTLQRYLDSAPIEENQYKELVKELKVKQIVIYVLIIIVVLNISALIFLCLKLRKEKCDEEVH